MSRGSERAKNQISITDEGLQNFKAALRAMELYGLHPNHIANLDQEELDTFLLDDVPPKTVKKLKLPKIRRE